jgi:hypothetical protein
MAKVVNSFYGNYLKSFNVKFILSVHQNSAQTIRPQTSAPYILGNSITLPDQAASLLSLPDLECEANRVFISVLFTPAAPTFIRNSVGSGIWVGISSRISNLSKSPCPFKYTPRIFSGILFIFISIDFSYWCITINVWCRSIPQGAMHYT